MTPDFFLKLQPGEDAWVLEDEHGEVVFYFKTTTAVRLAIQFRPSPTPAARLRNSRALIRGMRWIETIFRRNGFREVITDTEGPELRAFLKRRLGFEEALALTRTLHSPMQPSRMESEALGRQPTTGLERLG